MNIDQLMHTSAYLQNMQYETRISKAEERETEPEDTVSQKPVDLDQIDFGEGDEAMAQIRQKHGIGVYQMIKTDPALAWSMKGESYPTAIRVNKSV